MRLAVCCAAVVGICKDPICQVEPTPTASVQHAKKTGSAASLCYIETYAMMVVFDSMKANTIYTVLLFPACQGSQSVYFELLAAGLT